MITAKESIFTDGMEDIMELVMKDKIEYDGIEKAMQIKKASVLKEKLRDYTRREKGYEEIYELLSGNECKIDFRMGK